MDTVVVLLLMASTAVALRSTQNTDRKIIEGGTAGLGQYPYVVSLKYNNRHVCGGSIINATIVLTAANCFQGRHPKKFTVMAGAVKLNTKSSHYAVERVICHEAYSNIANDIALLILATPIKFNVYTAPIQLETEYVKENEFVVFTGWGSLKYLGPISNSLQAVAFRILSFEQCRRHTRINNCHLCTEPVEGFGACDGDEGGPAVLNDKQVAIISLTKFCKNKSPNVFTRVSFYMPWIKCQLSNCGCKHLSWPTN